MTIITNCVATCRTCDGRITCGQPASWARRGWHHADCLRLAHPAPRPASIQYKLGNGYKLEIIGAEHRLHDWEGYTVITGVTDTIKLIDYLRESVKEACSQRVGWPHLSSNKRPTRSPFLRDVKSKKTIRTGAQTRPEGPGTSRRA